MKDLRLKRKALALPTAAFPGDHLITPTFAMRLGPAADQVGSRLAPPSSTMFDWFDSGTVFGQGVDLKYPK
jgi:hypothetical protein